MANLMGMSVIEAARCEDLAQIAAMLPEARPELTAEGFAESYRKRPDQSQRG